MTNRDSVHARTHLALFLAIVVLGQSVAHAAAAVRTPAPTQAEAVEAALRSDPDAAPSSQGQRPIVPDNPAQAEAQAAQSPLPENAFDLQRAVLRGLAANPQITSARYQLLGAEASERAATSAFGFTTTATYGYHHQDEPTASNRVVVRTKDYWGLDLNVTQPLFTGFRLLNNFQRAKLASSQAESQIANAELTLILSVQRAFLALLQARENVRSSEDSVARLKSQLQTTQAFFDVGLRPRLDVLQAEVNLATAEQELLAAKNNVATQVARLNTLLNLPLGADVMYVGDLEFLVFKWSVDEGVQYALKNRPNLIVARKSVEIAEKDAGIAKSELYPQVSATFDYAREGKDPGVAGYDNSLDYESWQAGLSVNWMIFDFGQTYYNWSSAKENVSRVEAEYRNLVLESTYEIKSSHLQIGSAAERITVARKGVEAARESYRMAVARYQAQVGTITDVLDAQASLTRAEADLTQALTDYQSALAAFYNAIGRRNLDLAAN